MTALTRSSAGSPPLPVVAGSQTLVRRAVEKTEEFVPLLQILDALVPQVEHLVEVLMMPDVEEVIEVPKLALEDGIPRRAELREPRVSEIR